MACDFGTDLVVWISVKIDVCCNDRRLTPERSELEWERGSEPSGGLGFSEFGFEVLPQGGGASLDLVADAGDDAGVGDVVFDPAAAVVCEVEQGRHSAVDGVGEAGFGRVTVFELVPQGEEVGGAVGREEAEDALGGEALVLLALGPAAFDEGHGVAGIDLADVVDQKHFEDAAHVDGCGGEGFEGESEEGELPGVFGGVFQAVGEGDLLGCFGRGVGDADFAGDGFEAVGLEGEGEDVGEGCGVHGEIVRRGPEPLSPAQDLGTGSSLLESSGSVWCSVKCRANGRLLQKEARVRAGWVA